MQVLRPGSMMRAAQGPDLAYHAEQVSRGGWGNSIAKEEPHRYRVSACTTHYPEQAWELYGSRTASAAARRQL